MNAHYISEWPAGTNPLQSLRQKLLLAGFSTAHEVLALSNNFLRARLPKNRGVSDVVLDNARAELAAWISRDLKAQTVWNACNLDTEDSQEPLGLLSTGEAEFDELLQGGLRVGVTELVGEASSGKTQLCIQLCLQVQLKRAQGGLSAGAYYMASEGTFPTRRALQLAQARYGCSHVDSCELLRHIRLTPAETFEDLEHFALVWTRGLVKHLEEGRDKKPLGLLVIDSLAAPIRTEYSSDSAGFRQRGNDLNIFGERLKQLSHQLQICIIVVNQVSEIVQHPGGQLSFKADETLSPSSDHHHSFSRSIEMPYASAANTFASHPLAKNKQASLGLVWANQVDVRLCMLKSHRRTTGTSTDSQVRHLCVLFSPFSPTHGPVSYVDYIIQERGVVACRHTSGLVKRLKSLPLQATIGPASGAGSEFTTLTQGRPCTASQEQVEEEHMWKLLDEDVDMSQMDMEMF